MLWRFVMIRLSFAEASGSCHAEATKTTYCAHLCTTYLDISTYLDIPRNCGHHGHRSNCFNMTFSIKLVQQVSLCHRCVTMTCCYDMPRQFSFCTGLASSLRRLADFVSKFSTVKRSEVLGFCKVMILVIFRYLKFI